MRRFAWPLSTLAAANAFTCTIDEDCNLNGVCNQASSLCECVPEWTGAQCGALNLYPARLPPNSGYYEPGSSSWAGSMVADPDDSNLFHMFVTRMDGHCGLGSWRSNAEIIHATSRDPEGPYTYNSTVLEHFACGPNVQVLPDKTGYMMMHIGCGYPFQPHKNCQSSMGIAETTRGSVQAKTAPTHSPSPFPTYSTCINTKALDVAKPYTQLSKYNHSQLCNITLDQCCGLCDNDPECLAYVLSPPSSWSACPHLPYCFPFANYSTTHSSAGHVFGSKAFVPTPTPPPPPAPSPMNHCDQFNVSVMTSTSLFGPWKSDRQVYLSSDDANSSWFFPNISNPAPLLRDDGSVLLAFRANDASSDGHERVSVASAESLLASYVDSRPSPAVMPQAEDPFLWQDERGHFHMLMHRMYGSAGGHAFSRDALTWSFSDQAPYSFAADFTDGSRKHFGRRERPMLLLSERGQPRFFSTGVEDHGDHTYTLVQKVVSEVAIVI